jgi:flagellar basal body-associated protein FliL
MSVNNQPAGPNPSRKQPKRLRTIGVIVLLLGLAGGGVVYWIGTHSSEPSEDELLPGNAKAESRQMEILYGKMGLLTVELSDALKQPGTQASIIATVSVLIAAGCFYFARLSDDDTEAG